MKLRFFLPTYSLLTPKSAHTSERVNLSIAIQLFSLKAGSTVYIDRIGERAKRARHSQVCSIENRGYIYIYIYIYI